MNAPRLGGLCWLLTVEFFIAQFVAEAAWPGYSMVLQDISDLGLTCGVEVHCSPLALVFNAGIALNGLLIVAGIWLTRRIWPANLLTTVSLGILVVGSGIGCIMVGLFPLDVDLSLHLVGAALALFVACFGLLGLGLAVWRRHRSFAIYTLATGLVTMAGALLYAHGIYLGTGRGTMERVAAWPQTIWYMATGAMILRGYFQKASPGGS